MFDFRYHIVSLVAVFFALALGILLGSSIAEQGVLEKQRQAAFDKLISSIRGDIQDLQSENRDLRADLGGLNDFLESSYPALTRNRLSGKNFLIVASGDKAPAVTKNVKKVIADAGGFGTEFRFFGVNASTDLNRLTIYFPTSTLDVLTANSLILGKLYQQLSGTVDLSFIDQLRSQEIIFLEDNFRVPVTGAVIYMETDEKDPRLASSDLAVIDVFRVTNNPVVGVEETVAPVSLIPLFKNLEISTIDNIDQKTGQISLVYVLSGKFGNFGEKPTAESLVPDLSED